MKAKDVWDLFAFTDAEMIIDEDDNVIGCDSEELGKMICKSCVYSRCKCHPAGEVS